MIQIHFAESHLETSFPSVHSFLLPFCSIQVWNFNSNSNEQLLAVIKKHFWLIYDLCNQISPLLHITINIILLFGPNGPTKIYTHFYRFMVPSETLILMDFMAIQYADLYYNFFNWKFSFNWIEMNIFLFWLWNPRKLSCRFIDFRIKIMKFDESLHNHFQLKLVSWIILE